MEEHERGQMNRKTKQKSVVRCHFGRARNESSHRAKHKYLNKHLLTSMPRQSQPVS